jgi:hypothetical protein
MQRLVISLIPAARPGARPRSKLAEGAIIHPCARAAGYGSANSSKGAGTMHDALSGAAREALLPYPAGVGDSARGIRTCTRRLCRAGRRPAGGSHAGHHSSRPTRVTPHLTHAHAPGRSGGVPSSRSISGQPVPVRPILREAGRPRGSSHWTHMHPEPQVLSSVRPT